MTIYCCTNLYVMSSGHTVLEYIGNNIKVSTPKIYFNPYSSLKVMSCHVVSNYLSINTTLAESLRYRIMYIRQLVKSIYDN